MTAVTLVLSLDDDRAACRAPGAMDNRVVVASAFGAFHGGLLAVCWVAPPETGKHCLSRVEPALGALSGLSGRAREKHFAVFPAVIGRAPPREKFARHTGLFGHVGVAVFINFQSTFNFTPKDDLAFNLDRKSVV